MNPNEAGLVEVGFVWGGGSQFDRPLYFKKKFFDIDRTL